MRPCTSVLFIKDVLTNQCSLSSDCSQRRHPQVLKRIYSNKVRISVSNLDFNFLASTGPLMKPLMGGMKSIIAATVAPKFDMELDMIYGSDPSNPFRLQVRAPVVRTHVQCF